MIDKFNFNGMKAGGTLPISSFAHLEVTSPECLTVTVGNERTFIRRQMPGTFDFTFDTCIPFNRFAEWTGMLDGPFKFKVTEDKFQVWCGRTRTALKEADPADYPYLPLDGTPIFSCDLLDFQTAIKRTMFAAGKLPPYDVALIDNGKIIGLDGFRLAYASFPFLYEGDPHYLLIDPESLKAVQALEGETLTVKQTPHHHIFSTGSEEVIAVPPNIDKFFDYGSIFPTKFASEITIPSKDLLSALKTAKLFDHKIHLVITDQKDILVWATGSEVGDCHITKDADIKGKALEIYIDGNFLIDGLSAIDGDVVLKAEDENGKLQMEGNEWRYLVMPLVSD